MVFQSLEDFAVDAQSRTIIIVMELADGDLATYLEQSGHLPVDQANVLFQNLSQAILVMSQESIVHFDLKPENFLLVRRKNDDGKKQPNHRSWFL